MMRRLNLDTAEPEYDDTDPEGYRAAQLKVAPLIGGETMAGGYYVVPPGQANCPYHYESDEEWLLVLEGRLTVRHPEGEDELEAGDLVCFPEGPDGAHRLLNRAESVARALFLATTGRPANVCYPDSGHWLIRNGPGRDEVMVRESGRATASARAAAS
jgi:uncharacterized cupin superfamily protein